MELSITAIISSAVGLIMCVGAGIALLVRMRIDQSTMKVTVDSQGRDITDLKGDMKEVKSQNTQIQITLGRIEGHLGGKDPIAK